LPRFSDRPFARLALLGLLAAALSLGACGRKGPLDPPPGASLEGVTQPNAPGLISNNTKSSIGTSTGSYSGVGPDGQVQAPPGPKKHIPLDNLLN